MSQNASSLLEIVSLASAAAGLVGSASALAVDFMRRQVKAKAAEYAAKDAFAGIVRSSSLLQLTLEAHIKTSAENHLVICQRITRLETKDELMRTRNAEDE
jgi:hypothetical protein